MNKYNFRNYDPVYPELFKKEKERLRKYLPKTANIEHFGSTAVAGLGGKGIIDIYVTAPKRLLQVAFRAVNNAGYEFRPDAGTHQRLFFRRIVTDPNENGRRYHIHLINNKNPEFHKDIAFRDYLRSHPEDLKRYAEIKKKAAVEADNDKIKYMKIKEPVIQEILAKAQGK